MTPSGCRNLSIPPEEPDMQAPIEETTGSRPPAARLKSVRQLNTRLRSRLCPSSSSLGTLWSLKEAGSVRIWCQHRTELQQLHMKRKPSDEELSLEVDLMTRDPLWLRGDWSEGQPTTSTSCFQSWHQAI
ncbi:unnamed protein product [Pleuronectes platessa]|uniref:Uncharacterized protein n=1 Tax=Pleuronectes platessa TaxID=8262 RepID=A0A9N7ZBR9_PLEPL|nr:unnamed protein product [Pleuronectes platessa]